MIEAQRPHPQTPSPGTTPTPSAAPQPTGKRRGITSNPGIRAILAIVFFTYIGQNLLNVSIGPLSRELGLVEWAIGLALSVAAIMVALLAQFWGRHVSVWGRRRVLVISLFLAFLAGCTFAAGVWARDAGYISAAVATAIIILARGILFGAAVSGIPPAGQSLIAEFTPDEPSRVRGMAAFSGATNLSIMIGSALSAVLGSWWFFGPVYATPFLVGMALLVVLIAVPHTPRDEAKKLPPKMRYSDPRVLPWVLGVFGMFFANGVVQIIMSFVIQDRLGISPQDSMAPIGWLLLVIAAGAMFTQLIVVPWLVWSPHRLLKVGVLLSLIAFAVLATASHLWIFLIAAGASGVASGLAGPGFTAGGSLAVGPEEQGALAGLQHATGALTWIFAPASATLLYSVHPLIPFGVAGALLAFSTIIAWTHPGLRRR